MENRQSQCRIIIALAEVRVWVSGKQPRLGAGRALVRKPGLERAAEPTDGFPPLLASLPQTDSCPN